ncbi:chromate transporter [Brevibacillus marinus]|uniref:chromate transporter n=1 Tax=Brevibacillus marinus TaxID=2496837 RepID=UPI000F816C02|nr:chromate transporter [Brevibacillus marinus]
MVYWQLFLAFFRIGIFGFGGGPTMVPLFHSECVKKYKWVTDDDFADNLALGNALPGPIATKLAAFIGYRVKGWKGALVANIAVVLPVVILMIALLEVIYRYKDAPGVYGMVQAIGPVIVVMTGVMTWEFLQKGWQGASSKAGSVIWLFLSVAALVLLDLHPGIVVGAALVGSFAYTTWSIRKRKSRDDREGAA